MKSHTFSCVLDAGVRANLATFTRDISLYLADPDGWESKGHSFTLVSKHPEIVIHLTLPSTLAKRGCDPALNCAEMNGKHLFVNADLWSGKAPNKSQLSLSRYRQYIVSHEMGHILGYDHVKCPGVGQPAPIMLQQTKGIGVCVPNTKV